MSGWVIDTANVKRTLEVSTNHIPLHTADALGQGDRQIEPPLWSVLSYVLWHEYGWIMVASEDQVSAARDAGHPELANLLKFAFDNGFYYLQLDCDGFSLQGAPTFEW